MNIIKLLFFFLITRDLLGIERINIIKIITLAYLSYIFAIGTGHAFFCNRLFWSRQLKTINCEVGVQNIFKYSMCLTLIGYNN